MLPFIMAIALFMEQMDSTVIATALPEIARDLETSPIALKLAMTAYLVALAIFIPASGWIADRFGPKKVFLTAIAVFMGSSVLCSAADSLGFFVVARFVQGMGGAMMTPVARLVLVRGTPRNQLVEAMAWLTIPALAGPLVGPPVGGFITTYASWEWIFLIDIPIGLVGMAAIWRFLPQMPVLNPPPLDWTGFFLVAGAASGIVFGMSVISLPALLVQFGLVAIVAGAICLFAYWRHAHRAEKPILPLSLLSIPTLRASVAGGSFFRIGIGAVPFLLPLMLQLGYGLTAFESGMITFIGAVGAMSMKFAAVSIFRRFGFRPVLIATGILSSISVAAIAAFPPNGTMAIGLYLVLLISGFVRSLYFTGINALAYVDVPESQTAQATAMSAVAQQTSIAIGVAVAGAILEATLYFGSGELTIASFNIAFILVAAIMTLGTLPMLRIDHDAGAEASGRLVRRNDTTQA